MTCPVSSAAGAKTDITVCADSDALLEALSHYQKGGYRDALVQSFLDKQFEANGIGASVWTPSGWLAPGGIALKIREQLESATSYAVFIADNTENGQGDFALAERAVNQYDGKHRISAAVYEQLITVHRLILDSFREERYTGMFDVEYLVCEDTVFLNEINYRHSGNGYSMIGNPMNAPFLWAAWMLGIPPEAPQMSPGIGSCFMAELSDIIYIKRRLLTLRQWFRDIRRARRYAVYDCMDLRATARFYTEFVKAVLLKRLRKSTRPD